MTKVNNKDEMPWQKVQRVEFRELEGSVSYDLEEDHWNYPDKERHQIAEVKQGRFLEESEARKLFEMKKRLARLEEASNLALKCLDSDRIKIDSGIHDFNETSTLLGFAVTKLREALK